MPRQPTAFEQYETEFRRREELRGAAAVPVGVLTVLCGLLGAMAARFPLQGPGWWAFWTAIGFGAYLLARSTFHLIQSYHGHTYKYVSPPDELRAYRAELVDWHVLHGAGAAAASAEADEEIEQQYDHAATFNFDRNRQKSELAFRAHRELILAVLCLGAAYVPYVLHLRTSPAPVHIVRIVAATEGCIHGPSSPKKVRSEPASAEAEAPAAQGDP